MRSRGGMTVVESILVSYGVVSGVGTCAFLAWGWARAGRKTIARKPDPSLYAGQPYKISA